MSDPFIAEIRVVPYTFAPRGWAFCDGQLLLIPQHTALFALLGTMYGGDGRTNFRLPDLQGRVVLGAGQGPGLSPYVQGDAVGAEAVTLTTAEMPLHTHTARAAADPADLQGPAPDRVLARSGPGFAYQSDTAGSLVEMSSQSLSEAGGGQPHTNVSPVLVLNYVIALEGIFPSRS